MVTNAIHQLRFEDASFGYEESPKPLIEKLTLDLPLGKNVWISGEAGAGQSTFIKLVAVLLQPQSGRYLINGVDTTTLSFEEFLPMRLRIGYTFDFGGLFANLPLINNLMLPLLYHKILSPTDAEELVLKLADRFHFRPQLQSRPASVSGGLRKLVCNLRALMLRPEMLVMDDPFTALDPDSAKRLIELLGEHRGDGRLRHIFLTSRDPFWPDKLQAESFLIDGKKSA